MHLRFSCTISVTLMVGPVTSLSGNSEVCATWAIVEIVQPADFCCLLRDKVKKLFSYSPLAASPCLWPCLKLSALCSSAILFSFLFILLSLSLGHFLLHLPHPYNLPQFSPSLPSLSSYSGSERRKPGMGLGAMLGPPFLLLFLLMLCAAVVEAL